MFGFIFGGLLGFIGGAGAMLIAFPFLFPPAEVNEIYQAANSGEVQVLAGGSFRVDTPAQDGAHWGLGTFKVYDKIGDSVVLELQGDFKVGPGPNFWIYLNGNDGIIDEETFNADAGRIKVVKLKSFKGSQVYEIDRTDFESAKGITIWCETFSQYITSADIERGRDII